MQSPALFLAALLLPGAISIAAPQLEEVASFPTQQVTGVTVSTKNRVFVNFPFWSEHHTISVAEVRPGEYPKPYPDAAWNRKEGAPESRWICVQSVLADEQDALWVLDAAAPKTEAIVKGGPKLVKVDLTTNAVAQTISFSEAIVPERAYLNDLRIDNGTGHAYITESGVGALIVVDLKSGAARRLLADHPSTKIELEQKIVVDGIKVIDPKSGKAPAFQADGIALDKDSGWLYFHALTAETMYRVKTADLLNPQLSEDELAGKVEKLGKTPKPDGMLEGKEGVYLAAFEKNAVMRFDVKSKESTVVVQDPRLQWPDTMSWGPDGYLYVTTSQIHRMPKYHGGESKQLGPYQLFRFKVAQP